MTGHDAMRRNATQNKCMFVGGLEGGAVLQKWAAEGGRIQDRPGTPCRALAGPAQIPLPMAIPAPLQHCLAGALPMYLVRYLGSSLGPGPWASA